MKTINGLVLKQMIISGANNLYNCYPEIDALNVFPVPDGDTGTNMNLTITSGAKEVANRNDVDAYPIAKAFSKGLLMGARGNSGVILSQIFRGFAQGLEGVSQIRPTDLAAALLENSNTCTEIYDNIDSLAGKLKEKLQEKGIKVVDDFTSCQEGVILIAEPWTCGGKNCYHLGNFPEFWAEWNDVSRDTYRKITIRPNEITPKQIMIAVGET